MRTLLLSLCGEAERVLRAKSEHLTKLRFRQKAEVEFALYALFRLQPLFGRFPEGKDAKEKVIRAHYGKPLKPGCNCSLMHVLTTTYLAKDKADARLMIEKKEGQDHHLPDMTITVVSKEAWKDAGITDGSQVLISVFDEGHRFQLSENEDGKVSFTFNPRECSPLFIHCFLFWDESNKKSAKYGFICQLKTNNSTYLAARPSTANSARLSLISDSPQEDLLPELWGDISVDLCSNKDDGNSYWVVEKQSEQLEGGIIYGGEAFVLKHVFVRKYLGPGFRLVPRSQAQVFTFPYSGSHSPEETLKRLRAKKEVDEEPEDIVEMFERYPLLRISEGAEGNLVGCSCKPTKEHLWSKLMLPFAWTLRPGLQVRQELTYLVDSTPDSLLRFEVRETDARSAFQVIRVAGKIASFFRLHRKFEINPLPDEDSSLTRPDMSSQISLRTSVIQLETEHEEDPANISVMKVQTSDTAKAFLASLEANSHLSKLPKLLAVTGVHRKELDLMIDAQIFTEALRFVFLILTSTALTAIEQEEVAKHVSFLFPNQKLVWNSLLANEHLLVYLAKNHLRELTNVLINAQEYLQPMREHTVLLTTMIKQVEPRTKEVDSLIEALDPDALLKFDPKSMSLTELMTRKVFEISKYANFVNLLFKSTQKEREFLENIKSWSKWRNQIEKISQAAKKAEKVAAALERMQLSKDALVQVMKGVLLLFQQLVMFKIKQEDLKMKSGLLEDSEEVKPFVQASFRLINAYQLWVNLQVANAYNSKPKIVKSTDDVTAYIQQHLSFSSLICENARDKEPNVGQKSDPAGIKSVILAEVSKGSQRQGGDSFMREAQKGLIKNSHDPMSSSSRVHTAHLGSILFPKEPEESPPDIGALLKTIAKRTRFRVKDKPNQLLKMIDTALNPARSAVKVIDKLILKDVFKELVVPIDEVIKCRDFCACAKWDNGEMTIVPMGNFEEYVRRLEVLRTLLASVRDNQEVIKCVQQLLAASSFDEELRRMWSYCSVLSQCSEEPATRLRSCTFELSMFFVENNFKHIKAVFQMLTPGTFCVDYPEYINLLEKMNAIPRDDEVAKDLLVLIDDTAQGERAKAARTELLNFAQLFQLEKRDSGGQDNLRHIGTPTSISNLKQAVSKAVEKLEKKRGNFNLPTKAISLLFEQNELYKEDLYEKMKNVFLSDSLIERYLQTWRYMILSHRAIVKLSQLIAKHQAVPGLKLGEKGDSEPKPSLTPSEIFDNPNYAHIKKKFSTEEQNLLRSKHYTLLSKKDIEYISKRWQAKMQSLLERIIDYVCGSSNISIQRDELEVLAEIVKDEPDTKLAVINELSRFRQYRHFFGLFATIMEKRSEDYRSEAEKSEIGKLKIAFLKFFQAACDGCFSSFQHYLREQNIGQLDNINVIDVLTRALETLIVDTNPLKDEDRTLASELAITLLEAVSGPCSENIEVVCKYQKLLRKIGFFVDEQIRGFKISEGPVSLKTSIFISSQTEKELLSDCSKYAEQSANPKIKPPSKLQDIIKTIVEEWEQYEGSRKLKNTITKFGITYPKLESEALSLCTNLVNLMIALLEGNERRPEKIAELMPAVEFKQFETISSITLQDVNNAFYTKFETGKLLLNDGNEADEFKETSANPAEVTKSATSVETMTFANPGEVMNFAMRCCILYYTTLPEDEEPESKNKLLKYIGCVEIQQLETKTGRPEIHSVIFQVPFKALHLSLHDTSNVLRELSSCSHEENLKNFVSQLETYIGEMNYLQNLSQVSFQHYMRSHWKHTYWIGYGVLILINILIILGFDDSDHESHSTQEVKPLYCILIYIFGSLHSLLRVVWTYCYYIRHAYLIWHPLTDMESQNSLEELARCHNPGTIAAFFNMSFRNSITSTRVKGITRAFFNISMIPFSVFAMYHPWLYPFLLLEVSSMESTLENIIKAITNRFKQLLLTFAFAVLIMYLYAVLAYYFFRTDFDEQQGASCATLIECVVTTINLGMRSDGGIGSVMQTATSEMLPRVLFDMSFFILITTILMAIVFGIVVDTFGELRDEMNEAELNVTSICSICRQPRSSIEIKGEGWDKHCLLTHNPFAYLYFMAYVKEKDINDCSGVEKFVRQQLDRKDIGFFPTTFRLHSNSKV